MNYWQSSQLHRKSAADRRNFFKYKIYYASSMIKLNLQAKYWFLLEIFLIEAMMLDI